VTDEEVVAIALHQACIDRWANLADSVSKYVTKHGADVHLEQARDVIYALDHRDR
jgi:hypothetical protein